MKYIIFFLSSILFFSAAFADFYDNLIQVVDPQAEGLHDGIEVTSDQPVEMVREWALKVHQLYENQKRLFLDPSLTDEFLITDWSDTKQFGRDLSHPSIADYMLDTPQAGVLKLKQAISLVTQSIRLSVDPYRTLSSTERSKKSEILVKEAIETLVKLKDQGGIYFGYDGFQQSQCAVPTNFLLIIDTLKKSVEGIDLTPCS